MFKFKFHFMALAFVVIASCVTNVHAELPPAGWAPVKATIN